jgi:hypothetical protein
MGIKLDVSVETPRTDDDRDILAGISVMVLAIANRQNLADQPHMQDQDELELANPRPAARGARTIPLCPPSRRSAARDATSTGPSRGW